jgi:hypothetical protein
MLEDYTAITNNGRVPGSGHISNHELVTLQEKGRSYPTAGDLLRLPCFLPP